MSSYAGIVGHPLAHSLSPAFQAAAFHELQLDVTYELWDTPPESLPWRLSSFREPSCLGVNITIPHKEAVRTLLDEIDEEAARTGAVNTIVNRDGRLVGFNTDGRGFISSLRREREFEPTGRSFLVLGAGGAARGISFALAAADARMVAVTNRTEVRARRLVQDLGRVADSSRVRVVGAGQALDEFDCVINCTSVGMQGGEVPAGIPCDVGAIRDGALVVDIVYVPEDTPLIRSAKVRGNPTLGGLPMLVHQGALSFELWTGQSAPFAVMMDCARAALSTRSADAPG
ncbi:MAG TPA: shikimate dehydrogenase [Dehalococcoidia bacterium]|nr:shikimate dehydrogenase [Dehalococcoidia bacterium]